MKKNRENFCYNNGLKKQRIGNFSGDKIVIKFGGEFFVNKLRVGRRRLLRILKSLNKN